MHSLKRNCNKNLTHLESHIQTIRNQNIKMDHEKILKMLRKDLGETKDMADVKIMDYRIIKTIRELNNLF